MEDARVAELETKPDVGLADLNRSPFQLERVTARRHAQHPEIPFVWTAARRSSGP